VDATDVELGSRSPKCFEPFEFQPRPNQDERHDQQPKRSDASQGGWLTVAAATLPAAPQTVAKSWCPSPKPPGPLDIPEGGSGEFTKLSAALRAKLDRTADTTTLTTT